MLFSGVFLLFSAGLYLVVMGLLYGVNRGMKKSGVMDGEKEYTPENMEKLIEKRKVRIACLRNRKYLFF